MKKLIGWADGYLKECAWRDMALLKFCLGSLGVLIGLQVPKKRKKTACGGNGEIPLLHPPHPGRGTGRGVFLKYR